MTTPPTPEQLQNLACSGCVVDIVVTRGVVGVFEVDVLHDPACARLAKRKRRARRVLNQSSRLAAPGLHEVHQTRGSICRTPYGLVRHSARPALGAAKEVTQ